MGQRLVRQETDICLHDSKVSTIDAPCLDLFSIPSGKLLICWDTLCTFSWLKRITLWIKYSWHIPPAWFDWEIVTHTDIESCYCFLSCGLIHYLTFKVISPIEVSILLTFRNLCLSLLSRLKCLIDLSLAFTVLKDTLYRITMNYHQCCTTGSLSFCQLCPCTPPCF